MLSPTNVFTLLISVKRLTLIRFVMMTLAMTDMLATGAMAMSTTIATAQHHTLQEKHSVVSSIRATNGTSDHGTAPTTAVANATTSSTTATTTISTSQSPAASASSFLPNTDEFTVSTMSDTNDYMADSATGPNDSSGRLAEFPPRTDVVYFIVAVAGGAKTWSRQLARTLVDMGPPFNSSQGPPLRPLYVDLPFSGRWVKFRFSFSQYSSMISFINTEYIYYTNYFNSYCNQLHALENGESTGKTCNI